MKKNETEGKFTVRRIMMLALFLVTCIGFSLRSPQVTEAKTYKIRSASDWKKIGRKKGGTFKLTKNIRLTSTSQYLTISRNKKYIIDLNGHTVKTTYTGVALRTACPLFITKGTVILKSSKKNKGMLYSTETAAVTVSGKAKFYMKSGTIVNNATEFRSDITSAIMLDDRAQCYIQGKSRIQSIGNGIYALRNSKVYVTGNPYVRAGANNYTGQFTHYGSGIAVASPTATLSLKGGSFGTNASPDTSVTSITGTVYTYAQSANYPVLDTYGKALKAAAGYKYVDASGNTVSIAGSNLDSIYPGFSDIYGGEKKLTTSVKSADGYYTIYVVKK